MPLIEAAYGAFGKSLQVWAIGQDSVGNAKLVERHALRVPMLDDSALKVSFAYDLDTVPTIILADAHAAELRRFVGFGREDWRAMYDEMARLSSVTTPAIDWASYPESRPGCGSLSVDPEIAERLEAEARGERMTARRIELGDNEDVFEFMFERGLTDGLPVVPPTPARVSWMLTGTRRDPRDVVAVVPPNLAPVTVEKVAVNAVMAGCRPEYLPVVIAALEAVCTDQFNIHGIMSTTWGATPVMVVNGPIRHRLGMNMGMMALGYGTRSNATIGRALKLVLRNVGGARPGEIERSTLGAIGKFTTCFAEREERSPWEPLHVERGFKMEEASQNPDGASSTHVERGPSKPTMMTEFANPRRFSLKWLPRTYRHDGKVTDSPRPRITMIEQSDEPVQELVIAVEADHEESSGKDPLHVEAIDQPAGWNLHQGVNPEECGQQSAQLKIRDMDFVLDQFGGDRKVAAVDVVDEDGESQQEEDAVHAGAAGRFVSGCGSG